MGRRGDREMGDGSRDGGWRRERGRGWGEVVV